MKRLVICLDGTWNNASKENERDDGSRVFRPTNVLKMARATEKYDQHGNLQITYYDEGVGAMNRAPGKSRSDPASARWRSTASMSSPPAS